jgi:uncharacterized membrane protein SirB2
MYAGLKHAHMLFIAISIILFEYRYIMKVFNKAVPKALKVIPHINDTLLLVTGISMVYIASINPLEHSWLGAKIVALLLYIGFGMMALKSNGAKSVFGFIMATAVFIFMLFTAITKNPLFINI